MKASNVSVKHAFGNTLVYATIDGMQFRWNGKTNKYAQVCPNRELAFKNGRKNGDIEKGQQFIGMTRAEFRKSHGKQLVKLFDAVIVHQLKGK